ncbi:MAG: MalY/PatB family protein [Anaeroplasmataceae bacterium]
MYDFDIEINRYNTNSLKYDFKKQRGLPNDVIPLWVADMDFQVADEIKKAIIEKAEHGIFGYSEPLDDYFEAFNNWFYKHHGWKAEPSKIVLTCGVVFALATAINTLTNKNDSVIINNPVYYPFSEVILDNERKLISSDLVNNNGHYEIDFKDFEKKIINNNVKLFILCNPHNPVGRVWKKSELDKLIEICIRHNVFIISDEIHCDFTFENNKHISLATYGENILNNSIICTSASKTFNLAGLHNANIYIYNDRIRNKFIHELNRNGYSQSNVMGIVASEAAYTYGEEWYKEVKEYIYNNYKYALDFINNNIPKAKVIKLEGTYLLWIDLRDLNLGKKELKDFIINEAHLWVDMGDIFGSSGSGFIRINIATNLSIIKKALNNLKKAILKL